MLTLEIKPEPLALHLGGVGGVRGGRRRVFLRPAPPLLPESISSFFGGGGGEGGEEERITSSYQ